MKKVLFFSLLFIAAVPYSWGQYCTTSLYTTGCTVGDDLDAISLASYNQSPTGCSTNGEYEDFTTDTIGIQQAVSYNISVSTNYFFGGENFGVWVDFNDDNDFDDAGEFITFSPNTFDSNAPSVQPFIIGSTTNQGYHRMRVRLIYQATPVLSTQSCTSETWGEVHDYTINVLPPPPCPPPFGIVATTLTDTQVEVAFNSTSGVSNIEYGPSGFTPGTGTLISNVTSPYAVGSLSANTQYDFYVQDDCSASSNGTSTFGGPDSATTRSAALTAPYVETFDTITGTPSLSAAWLTFSSNTKVWQTTNSVGNGPLTDNTTGVGNYAFVDDNTFPFPNSPDVTMITPLVDVSTLTVPVLEFFYWSNPTNGINRFYVDIWDGSSWNTSVVVDSVGTAGTWQQTIVDLTNFTVTGPVMARFIVDEDNGFPFPTNQVSLDDIGFVEMPACPNPSFLSISSVTSSGALASWNGSTNDQFDVEVGAAGFTPGTGTIFTSTSNSVALTSLSPGTLYDVYLYNNCTVSSSVTSDTIMTSFNTSCSIISSFPYNETFDGPTWVSGTGFGNTNDTIDFCWSRSPLPSGNNYFWGTRTGATGSTGTGPTSDFSGTGNYVFTEGSNGGTGDLAYINMPDFDLTSLTTPWLSYYYHMVGGNMGTLNVQVSVDTGLTWTTISTWVGEQQTNVSDPWREDIIDITAYKASLVKIRFEAIRGNGFATDIAIDAATIQEAPPCPKPLSISAIGTTDSSITLTWLSSDTTFNVEWGPVGFSQGTGTSGTFGNDTSTISGLMTNGCYDFYVRTNCSSRGDGTSSWVGPFTACTDCVPVTALPWTEDWDGNGLNCWTIINNDGDGDTWELDTVIGTSNSPSNSAAVNSPFFSASDDWLISPRITLTGNERLKYSTRALFAFDAVELTVLISTTGDDIASFTDTLVAQTTIAGTAYAQTQANLSAYTGDVYLAYAIGVPIGFNSGGLRLDDVIVEPLPACLEPDSLNLIISGSNFAVLNWNPGGGTTWNLEYGTPGYVAGNGTVLNTNLTTDTAFGLTPSTEYDFYVQSDCGISGTSVWIGPLTVKTTCLSQTLPYTESFDVDLGCMTAIDGGTSSDTWIWSAAGGTTTFGDLDGTGYAIVDSDEFGNGFHMVESLNSPPIDAGSLPTTSSLIVEFDQFYQVIGNDSGRVDVFDGNSWVTLLVMKNQSYGAFGAPDHITLDATAYANANFQVRFWYDDDNDWAWWWAVDNFSVTEQLCGIASGLDTSFVSPTVAGLSWTSNGANWNIEWGPTGFSQGTGVGNMVRNATSNPFTLSGLTPGTCYDYYVQDTCLGIGNGPWIGPYTFCTVDTCTLPQPAPIPFTENFDGSGFTSGIGFGNTDDAISICWTRFDNTGGSNFLGTRTGATGSTGTGPSGASSTPNYIFYEASGSGVGDSAWLVSPSIDLSGASSAYFRYEYHMFGVDIGDLVTEINSGAGWVNLNTLSGAQQNSDTDPFITDSIDISSFSGVVRFRFIATSGGGFASDIAIDNMVVGDASVTCTAPTGLDTTGVGCADAMLTWVSSSSTVSSVIEYGPTGFTPGSGTVVTNATSPTAISGLTPGTAYDWYIVDICASDTSSIVSSSFTTSSGPISAAFTFNQTDTTFTDADMDFDGSSSVGANSYAWNFGDGNTGTGMNATNTYLSNGTYTVTLIITGDCGIDSISQQVVIAGISLTENRIGRSLEVYPNPTRGMVNVSFETEHYNDITISILDLSGKVIMSQSATGLNEKYDGTVDISQLARGTYMMKIESGGISTQRRIIKQ